MKKVIVKKDNQYYFCLPKKEGIFKCGKCLFGLLLGAESPLPCPNICKRCGAKHYSTTWGNTFEDIKVFYSNL